MSRQVVPYRSARHCLFTYFDCIAHYNIVRNRDQLRAQRSYSVYSRNRVWDYFTLLAYSDGESVTTEYVHALSGATVELRCPVTASRHADVRWRRDGVELAAAPDGRLQFRSDDALDIVDVQLDDAGQYTCHVVNAFGDVQRKRFVVQVIGTVNV